MSEFFTVDNKIYKVLWERSFLPATVLRAGSTWDTTSVPCAARRPSGSDLRLLYWNIQNGMWSDQANNYNNFVAWVKKYDPDICVWCDRTGNTAVVSHKNNNNDSERLEEAIEGCVNYQDVMDDWLEENSQYADQDPMDAFEESRLDSLMAQLV